MSKMVWMIGCAGTCRAGFWRVCSGCRGAAFKGLALCGGARSRRTCTHVRTHQPTATVCISPARALLQRKAQDGFGPLPRSILCRLFGARDDLACLSTSVYPHVVPLPLPMHHFALRRATASAETGERGCTRRWLVQRSCSCTLGRWSCPQSASSRSSPPRIIMWTTPQCDDHNERELGPRRAGAMEWTHLREFKRLLFKSQKKKRVPTLSSVFGDGDDDYSPLDFLDIFLFG